VPDERGADPERADEKRSALAHTTRVGFRQRGVHRARGHGCSCSRKAAVARRVEGGLVDSPRRTRSDRASRSRPNWAARPLRRLSQGAPSAAAPVLSGGSRSCAAPDDDAGLAGSARQEQDVDEVVGSSLGACCEPRSTSCRIWQGSDPTVRWLFKGVQLDCWSASE
jgi:hypothetical protein